MNLSVFTLIYISTVACLIFLSFLFFKKEAIAKLEYSNKKAIGMLIIMMLLGLGLRMLFFAAIKGYDSDISCWVGWGVDLLNNGFSQFYTAPGHEWYDYPPGYMLVLYFISLVSSILHLSSHPFFGKFIYLCPSIIADMINAYILYRLSSKDKKYSLGLVMAAFVIFNPAVFFLSGAWGQIDSILSMLLIMTFILMYKERYFLMGIFLGLAIATKWQALIVGPVLVVALIAFHNYKGKNSFILILKALLGGISAISILFLLSLPFKGGQGIFWIVDRFQSSTGGYNYASIEAYNFIAMCGGNWRWADDPFIFGISYKAFGIFMIIVVGIITVISCIIDRLKLKNDFVSMKRRIFLHATFFSFGVYTFGHYMHERYIFPVLFFIIFASVLEEKKDLLFVDVLLSSVIFLNEMVALYVAKPGVIDTIRFTAPHNKAAIICGVFEVITFAYFCFIYFNRNKKKN